MILVVVAVVVAAAGILGLTMRGGGEGGRRASSDLSSVRRGSFDITIPTSGELTAQDQIEIRNRLDKRAVITEIVPEGTWVKPGDVLLRLNDDELRNEVNDAIDEVNVVRDYLPPADFYDPVIEAYKKDIDRTLLRENLKLTVEPSLPVGELKELLDADGRGNSRIVLSTRQNGHWIDVALPGGFAIQPKTLAGLKNIPGIAEIREF